MSIDDGWGHFQLQHRQPETAAVPPTRVGGENPADKETERGMDRCVLPRKGKDSKKGDKR